MRRLTERYRKYLLHRQHRERRRRGIRPTAVVSQRRELAYRAFQEIRALMPDSELDCDIRPGFATLKPPEVLSISDNLEATLAFILDMRSLFHRRFVRSPDGKVNLRVFADFAVMRSVEPAAGLILAAEVDRWRLASGKQPRSYDRAWHPAVKRFFVQAGLFELLGIQQEEALETIETTERSDDDVQTLRFVRGSSVFGALGSDLRDRLEKLCGKSIGPRLTVYEAIAEAIANTRHAYPPGTAIWPAKLAGRWWASGTWRPSTNTVSVQLYDQGVGIPATLPRSSHWSDIIKLAGLGEKLHPERRDDQLITAALELGRTSTGEKGRGKGLAEMAAWIDKLGSGFLRITSGRGMVTYSANGATVGKSKRVPLPGTLIEWEICLRD